MAQQPGRSGAPTERRDQQPFFKKAIMGGKINIKLMFFLGVCGGRVLGGLGGIGGKDH